MERVMEAVFHPSRFLVARTLEDLHRKLLQGFLTTGIIVLFAPSRQHLEDLLKFREQLLASRLILVVPDQEKETIANAHSLRPRFVSCVEEGFLVVAEVLVRLMNGPDASHTAHLQWLRLPVGPLA